MKNKTKKEQRLDLKKITRDDDDDEEEELTDGPN